MMDLAGTRVLVTRPAHQAEPLCRAIEAAGGIAVRLPLIEILPPRQAVARAAAGSHDWLIFISPNAVSFGLPEVRAALPGARLAAVGKATARALREAGHMDVLVPTQGHDSEALLARDEFQDMAGQRVLIVRGEGGRELLADSLRQRGAVVAYIEVYQRQPSAIDHDRVAAADADIAILTSGQALQVLADAWGDNTLPPIPMVVISSRLAALARRLGAASVTVARAPDAASLLQACVAR